MLINQNSIPSLDDILHNIPVFQPFAYYDKHLDCIRVQTHDCSITEKRINRIFTVLLPNHYEVDSEFVGFNIKGIRHLFNQIGLQLEGVVTLTTVFEGIIKWFPEKTMLNVIRKLQTDCEQLEIHFDEAA